MIHINKLLTFFLIILISLGYIAEANALNTYTLEYDANGNLIKDNFYSYEYNSFNQLKKVYNNAGQLIEEYKYDENSERILKKEYFNGETQTTYYVSKDFVRIVNSTGSYDFVYYYDDRGNLLGRKDPDGKKYFYHPDHLGSTSIVTDEEGNVVEETSYTPFGALLTGGESKFLYTGKEKDQTGLYYYGARYYNANFGRFTQPDTIIPDVYDPQSLNRYSYVRNNPYKYVDPDGHVAWDVTLDPMLLAWAINDYNNNPNFWNGLDVTLSSIGMAPVLPSLGIISRGGKIIDKSIDSLKLMLKDKKAAYYGFTHYSDETLEIVAHQTKHIKKGLSEKELIKMSSEGKKVSLFSNKINHVDITLEAYKNGKKSGKYIYYDAGKTIGYAKGKSTQYIKIDFIEGEIKSKIHGYPILEQEYLNKISG